VISVFQRGTIVLLRTANKAKGTGQWVSRRMSLESLTEFARH